MSDIDPNELSRRDDPDTSRRAAEDLVRSGGLSSMLAEAVYWLKLHPGHTAKELEIIAGRTDGQIRKRLNDALKKGLAKKGGQRPCKHTGEKVYTWEPT